MDTRFGAIDTRFGAMDARLDPMDTRLDAMDTRLDAMDHKLDAMDHKLDAMEIRLRTYVDERIEVTETRLLTAFHNWASPSEARQRTHAAALRAIDLEMEPLSERVTKLEGTKPQ
jgi:tetrahydromethanopterin S-methyltransferase subunit B